MDNRLKDLVKLFLVGDLPPNIKVIKVRVRENWEEKLVLSDVPFVPFADIRMKMTAEEEKKLGIRKEDVELEEDEVDGYRVLAGFGQQNQVLVIGIYLESNR